MYFIGYDIGSSSIKAALLDASTGKLVGQASSPDTELTIQAPRPGWAEQDPNEWWRHVVLATRKLLSSAAIDRDAIGGIGIAYQMHGLVTADTAGNPVRPAIIWCDSRAVEIGEKAAEALGSERCLNALLNTPGNFTASKLKWVHDNEPDNYRKIHKIMLPGDFVAFRLTGRMSTTLTGLSEGTLWDFSAQMPANFLLDHYSLDPNLLAEIVPAFGPQGQLSDEAASELDLKPGIPVGYRAGDQPNNAFSLGVLEPGEVAATGGTSGVVYAVGETVDATAAEGYNFFAHVNYAQDRPRYGALLCLNGAGSLYGWLRRSVFGGASYRDVDAEAEAVPAASDGLTVLPFGNGAERVLNNRSPGATFEGLQVNTHGRGHLARASLEGIAYAFAYGMERMRAGGIPLSTINAGRANLFLSPIFRSTLASVSGCSVQILETDGAGGAARGAALGLGAFATATEAFAGLERLEKEDPVPNQSLDAAFANWKSALARRLSEI